MIYTKQSIVVTGGIGKI